MTRTRRGGPARSYSELSRGGGSYIPTTFDAPHTEEFDTEYMRALFKVGYEQASKGDAWAKRPPGM